MEEERGKEREIQKPRGCGSVLKSNGNPVEPRPPPLQRLLIIE